MGFSLRESNNIRAIKSTDGQKYFLQKSAYGFSETYTFYNEENEVIEEFFPRSDYDGHENVFDDESKEIINFYGREIEASFSYEEFFL